jgi:MSHA pilin protein MshC
MCRNLTAVALSHRNCYTTYMLIVVFQELKSLLSTADGASCAIPSFLDDLQWSWSTRSEIHNPKSGGFTLIELVMVIVLIGILAAFAAPKFRNITTTNAGAFTDKLRADIRYAQNLAMTRNKRARVYFNGTGTAPNPGYAVVIDTNGACSGFIPAADPARGVSLSVILNTGNYAGITVTPTAGMNCLEYDSLGRPYNCNAVPANCLSPSSGLVISVNANAVAVGAVTVTAQTGAVN